MRRLTFQKVRDAVLLTAGLLIAGYEMLIPPEPRGIFIGLAAGMMGLPAAFLADRWWVRDDTAKPPKDSGPPADSPDEHQDSTS